MPKINEVKTKRCQFGIDWTWKHLDLDRLCPKFSPDTERDLNGESYLR